MVQTVQFLSSIDPLDVPAHTVYLRSSWAADWVEAQHLHCDWATWNVAPAVSRAALWWRYGKAIRPGKVAWEDVAPLSVGRNYVKIVFDASLDPPLVWYGTVELAGNRVDGSLVDGQTVTATGQQRLICYGLEQLLKQRPITSSYWRDGNGNVRCTGRGITFNENGLPNRLETAAWQAYEFCSLLSEADFWSTRDIVDYLLAYQTPVDAGGQRRLQFVLGDVPEHTVPDWDKPQVRQHGQTAWQILNSLLARQRLLSFFVHVAADDQTITVNPFTFNETHLMVENSFLAANNSQKAVQILADPGVAEFSLKDSSIDAVDQVVVTGARRQSCFTVFRDDDTLDADWTSTQQTEYNAGGSGEAGYPLAAERAQRQQWNKEWRAAPHLEAVYRRFRLPADWDGQLGEYSGGAPGVFPPAFPEDDDPDEHFPVWVPGLKLLSVLPIREVNSPSTYSLEEVDNEYAKPFAVFPLPEYSTRWVMADKVGEAAEIEPTGANKDKANRKWSASVRVLRDSPRFEVRVTGQPQHVIAYTDFSGVPEDEAAGEFDWRDMMVTIAVEDDRYCSACWPTNPDAAIDSLRVKRIDAGPGFRLDWVAKGTVLGIDKTDGSLVTEDSGRFERDDRDALLTLALIAWQWYGATRRAAHLKAAHTTGLLQRGDLITSVSQDGNLHTLSSVITQVRITIPRTEGPNSPPGPPVMSWETQFGELDPVKM